MKKYTQRQDSKITNKEYSKFLKNKKVILVGPAWHTKHTKQVDLIESYDIVVRMNMGARVPNEKVILDIGSKINIWYCSLSGYFFKKQILTSQFLHELKKRGVQWICCPFTAKRGGGLLKLKQINQSLIPVHVVNHEYYKILVDQSKNKITTGLVTIYDLLQFDIKELYVMGMSFYRTDVINKKRTYYSGYQDGVSYVNVKQGKHNLSNELYLFSQLCEKYNKIYYDDVLTQILANIKK